MTLQSDFQSDARNAILTDAHILVVDDEPSIQTLLRRLLGRRYTVTTAANGQKALDLVAREEFDLALLDIHLPDMNGFDVLEALHTEDPHIVVIVVTKCQQIESAVRALRSGARHYLQKPISRTKLLESVETELSRAQRERTYKAALRRTRQLLSLTIEEIDKVLPDQTDLLSDAEEAESPIDSARFVQRGPLLIDTHTRQVTVENELLDLTSGEYDLLLCLAENAPDVVDPRELVEATRGFETGLNEARELIRWQIYLLRQKIELDPSSPQYILNVRGQGYMWAGG